MRPPPSSSSDVPSTSSTTSPTASTMTDPSPHLATAPMHRNGGCTVLAAAGGSPAERRPGPSARTTVL
jgi:hypothetical protein